MASNITAIWLFDGVCVLCSSAVRYTLSHEKAASIQFIAIQSKAGITLAEKYGVDPENPDSFLFIENGIALTKSDALLALAEHLKGIARLSPVARLIPRSWRDGLYDLLAQNRYKWFGRKNVCDVPDLANRHRFILPEFETAER
jgi:predicted DCC family thiol-disulfide oxidoreductase YuxK